jgi:hypothetical protein
MTFEDYKNTWAKKTKKQIEKELKSMQSYVQKHSAHYVWHGRFCTAPNSVSDGDKITALKELLK